MIVDSNELVPEQIRFQAMVGGLSKFAHEFFRVRLHAFANVGFGCARRSLIALVLFSFLSVGGNAAVPLVLHFQGHIASAGLSVDGFGEFKFALVDGNGLVSWSNAPIPDQAVQPERSVSVNIDKGFYSVRLGDTTIGNMEPLTLGAFQSNDLKLRVWFSDGVQGFEQLSPDQPLAASAFAVSSHHAEIADVAISVQSVPDGLIELRHLQASLVAKIAQFDAQIAELDDVKERVERVVETMAVVSINPADPELLGVGFQRFTTLETPSWETGSGIGAPLARYRHTGVWTGNELLIWGGTLPGEITGDGGGIYSPSLDQWSALSPFNAPSDRRGHSAVWTGTEMIIWGGFCFPGLLSSGGRFEVATHTWNTLSKVGVPSARTSHGAVWGGEAMFIWGGRGSDGPLNDGAAYQPATDTWTPLPVENVPEARFDFTTVWAGDRLLVWGGKDGQGRPLNSGGQLVFSENALPEWRPISFVGAPSARSLHTAVWAFGHLFVWGGEGDGLLGDGAAYNPFTDTWLPMSPINAPTARALHMATWTGTEMLVYGGNTTTGPSSTGHAFDPASNSWRNLTLSGNPVPRAESSVAWAGDELLLFGGRQNGTLLGSIQRLNPRPPVHFYRIP